MTETFLFLFFSILKDIENPPITVSVLISLLMLILVGWVFLLVRVYRSYKYSNKHSIGNNKKLKFKQNNNKSSISFPFVSIIVPARNEQDNIEKCLESLINQDYSNFEIVVVDDDSTDTTLQKIRKVIQSHQNNRIKVLSLKSKPDSWTGKTWASQQGYLSSHGSILLFVDADTIYKKDALSAALSYMLIEKLDVLTGYPFIKLQDFWSKVSMPLWKLMFVTLDKEPSDVNDPKSKVAYLLGCFFMVKREVFEKIGGFEHVRNAIQEDEALGVRTKQLGYRLKMVNLRNFVFALWSRDMVTLWQGIGRTLAPIIIKDKKKVIVNFLSIIFMALVPFAIIPFTISSISSSMTNGLSGYDGPIFYHYLMLLLVINLLVCSLVVIGTIFNATKLYRISSLYPLLAPIGLMFLVAAYLSTMVPLLLTNSKKQIIWKGRAYNYKRLENTMT